MYKPYKILALATSMEYGGGETHILELSKYLKSNGVEIKIMSNGEELFESEIKNSGIEHIYAPFHSRNILDMRKAAKILKKAIKSYKPDVIHAHSRIPAFVASKVCKKFKIPLVTTMHGTFKQSFLLKLFTNWGDYSLYVSDDIKNYWQKYYKLKDGYMFKTVNGINTELFNVGRDDPARRDSDFTSDYIGGAPGSSRPTDIRRELGIKPEEKIILTIGRLENRGGFNLAYSAVKLCEIAEDIYIRDNNTRIIIVGDGENSGGVKKRANEINSKLGFEYIIMTGKRADAYKFCSACSVSVGVSRFALETLACEKPVIMCGGMGYLGRFTKENAGKCELSNFTCRNFGYPDDINNVLLNEILFSLDAGNKNILEADAKFGADLVRDKYSVKKMADDAYEVYQKAVLKYKDYDFTLGGYYGYNNMGDDALLFTVISSILQKKRALKICVLTKSPKKIQKWLDGYFCNIIAKPRFNFINFKNALIPVKPLKKSKALVFGGGTLLSDNTSGRSFWYYSSLLRTAQKLGKKTILYANGIGPIYSDGNRKKAIETVKNITMATIRDEDSYNYLINMGIDKDKIYLTADEAVTIKQNRYLNAYKKDFKEFINHNVGRDALGTPLDCDYIVLSIRKWKSADVKFFEKFAAAIDIICRENHVIPVYLVMRPKDDKKFSEYLTQLNGKAYFANVNGDIEKALSIIRSAKAVISMRLHTLIFAAAFGIPMLGIAYDPKVKSFLNSVFDSDGYTLELKDLSKDKLAEKYKILMSNENEVKEKINDSTEKLREKAAENAELFMKAMEFESD